VDTVHDPFLRRQCIVFFSHQWLGYLTPDPDGTQFRCMAAAVGHIAARDGVSSADLYVWVDWVSIPQRVRAIQRLAIDSLPLFAALGNRFVVVAPEAVHQESGVVCNATSYHRRTWCRAEVMSHWSRRGTANMFYADETGLRPMTAEEDLTEFLASVHVFGGELACCALKHPGGMPCDREQLVFPMLGLYAQIYQAVAGRALLCMRDGSPPPARDAPPTPPAPHIAPRLSNSSSSGPVADQPSTGRSAASPFAAALHYSTAAADDAPFVSTGRSAASPFGAPHAGDVRSGNDAPFVLEASPFGSPPAEGAAIPQEANSADVAQARIIYRFIEPIVNQVRVRGQG